MIRVCYYKGCGAVFGEKEPLFDKRVTHGLCPKHLKISLTELKTELKNYSLVHGKRQSGNTGLLLEK